MPSSTFGPWLRPRARQFGAWALAVLALGCAGTGRPKQLADGTYRLQCKSSLSQCLAIMAEICPAHGYEVLSANEHRARYGPEGVQTHVLTAEAKARCNRAHPLFGSQPSAPPATNAAMSGASTGRASNAPAPASASSCFPGITQNCRGPGACAGAQACAADGKSFGPCDCSPAPTSGTSAPVTMPGTTTPSTTTPDTPKP
jgi:hypothetical protein